MPLTFTGDILKYILAAWVVLMSVNFSLANTDTSRASTKIQSVDAVSKLHVRKWNHGSPDCNSNRDPAIEVFGYDQSSYILRQNKCQSFEAPFIYLLIGQEKVLVLDTGAPETAENFPLYETVQKRSHPAFQNSMRSSWPVTAEPMVWISPN